MRRCFIAISILCLLAIALPAGQKTVSGGVLKVLPHLLDLKGRHTLSPSLYERDAYQAYLRSHPEEVSGIRYDIQWKSKNAKGEKLKLRVQLRSDVKDKPPGEKTMETEVEGGRGREWTSISLTGDDFKSFGKTTAWRVTLWNGDELLGEQKSFLW
ncbi:MAG TPA: hypothetical protein PKA41_13500 [Verrucomicrobiota bacterium]|nr:hypothetical protein [Verrucomicrobiota bacterium]